MAVVTMKQLLEAGVHFGHQTRRWNPKMRRFIFGERNGIYIIDLQQTLERIDAAYRFIRGTVENGGTVLFVGTKKQSQEPIQREAERSSSPYINYRWLGGTLTNFQTVHARVAKLHELRRLVDTGETEQMLKKEGLKVKRELTKLERNLGGIQGLEKLPTAVFVIDTKKEHIAVTEANRLNIPVVAVVDTNCDPDIIDYVIPGNDDAIRSANLMCRIVADAVVEGHQLAAKKGKVEADAKEKADKEKAGKEKAAKAKAAAPPPPPPPDPEEAARKAEAQREARNQAAAAQREREARLAASKDEAKDETPPEAEAGAEASADEAPKTESVRTSDPEGAAPASSPGDGPAPSDEPGADEAPKPDG